MSLNVTKDLKTPKGINVKVSVQTTKKSPLANVLFSCESSAPGLLTQLLRLFATEKHLTCCTNANTGILDVAPGYCSIAFVCPDNKVFSNLCILYNYLLKTKLPASLISFVDTSKESYKKHLDSLKNFKVSVFGKCKCTATHLIAGDKKCEQFLTTLDATLEKYKDAKDMVKENTRVLKVLNNKTFATADNPNKQLTGLYLAILLDSLPCTIKVDMNNLTINFLDPCDTHWCNINKSTFQGKIKTFLTQFGATGSPSGEKYKEKCEVILESLNKASEQLCVLHNIPVVTFKTGEEIAAVNKEVLNILKSLKEC